MVASPLGGRVHQTRLHWGRWLFLSLMTVMVLPFLWTLLASFHVEADNTVTPPTWTLPPSWDAYQEIQAEQTYFWQEFATTAFLSAATTVLTVFVAFLAAYALARSPFRYRALVIQSLLILASLPVVSYFIPLQEMMRAVKLFDTFAGVVLAETGLFAPLVTYILYGYIAHSPVEFEESARLDGATLNQILWQVTLPTIASGAIATAVITYVLSWNQFFLPLMLTEMRIKAIPVMMRGFFALERDFEWPKAAAVIVVSLLPVGVFVGVAHRFLEQFSLNVMS